LNEPHPTPDEDRRLLSRCFSGDRKASENLVRRFSGLVYKTVQRTLLTKNVPFSKQDMEDLHNTVFLKLLEHECKKLRQYRGKNGCSLASWIRVVTVRTVLNHIRKKGMDAIGWQRKRLALEDISELKSQRAETLAVMERSEQERLLEEGIQHLSARDRLFVKLHFEKAYSVEEIAETMRISTQNLYTIKHRVIQRIKNYVEKAGY